MCGIAAIIRSKNLDPRIIEKMVKELTHRGPDGSACTCLPGCHLGHTRLSIIDLETGRQPMADVTGRYWITYNGEIYNYKEMRKELIGRGYCFQTQSDTEVILASYAEWGTSCLDRFRGMFAFAIWDAEKSCVFAARDLFGEKPLYYALLSDGTLVIGSEIRALVASGLFSPNLDLSAVDAYLALGYIPPDRTIYKNVQVLPPGHWLKYDSNQVTRRQYWKPRFRTEKICLEEAAARLRELVAQAVRRQMVADVPVGAFLSGGLDSSTIVALMQTQASTSIKTFSVGFGGLINELPYARQVAEQYRTEHYEISLELPPLGELFEQVAAAYDEPFGDSSNIPTYLISQFAHKQVKAVLSGDGGDELFGGYQWYLPLARSERVVATDEIGFIGRLLRWKRPRAGGTFQTWTQHVRSRLYFSELERRRLWAGRGAEIDLFRPGPYFLPEERVSGIDQAFFFDLTSYLPGDILVKVDRAAMANSLETRAPFLDPDLVEFALTLPSEVKVTAAESKILMRFALSELWPPAIRNRSKQGFGVPFSAWLRHPDLQGLTNRVFAEKSRLRQLLRGLRSSENSPDSYQTWLLLALGIWLEQHPVEVA